MYFGILGGTVVRPGFLVVLRLERPPFSGASPRLYGCGCGCSCARVGVPPSRRATSGQELNIGCPKQWCVTPHFYIKLNRRFAYGFSEICEMVFIGNMSETRLGYMQELIQELV